MRLSSNSNHRLMQGSSSLDGLIAIVIILLMIGFVFFTMIFW